MLVTEVVKIRAEKFGFTFQFGSTHYTGITFAVWLFSVVLR